MLETSFADPARAEAVTMRARDARLAEVKTAYGPDNLFSSIQNIPPAQASSV